MISRAYLVLAVILVAAGPALAGPYADVAGARIINDGDGADDGARRFDVHATLGYGLGIERAAILREHEGLPGTDPDGSMPKVKDLVLEGSQQLLVPRVEIGVYRDLALSLTLPVVIAHARTLRLDQRATPCVFPGGDQPPTCIDRTNSSTVTSGLLPAGGYDAAAPDGNGFTDADTLFRGPSRSGIDQLHLGLTWAAMNQRRDDTKPTWKLGVEARLAIGTPMRLVVDDPASNTGVGRGVHELKLWTSYAKRLAWVEPYMDLWWLTPLATSGRSHFTDLGFGQTRIDPQQQVGTRFGVHSVAWRAPDRRWHVAVDASALIQAHLEGRAYTPMWEVFQYAGSAGRGGPLVLDADPTEPGLQALSHPGVTAVENYMRVGGRLGVAAVLSPMVHIGASLEIVGTQSHAITYADAGIDLPTCTAERTTGCEVDENTLVNPGTAEVNPAHVPLIDLVGRRYFIDGAVDYLALFELRILY